MCTYSMVADHYKDVIPQWPPRPHPMIPLTPNDVPNATFQSLIDAAWKADIERRLAEMEQLLRRAQKYDEENGEPECELESKKQVLRDLAKQLGVEINLP